MSQIIRSEQDGIEFYTIAATGESGMSQTGLAILAGVNQSTISDLHKTLMGKAPSESLEPWVGRVLTLMCDENPIIDGKPAGNLTIYRADFCAAVIQHYAFKGNKVAQHSLSKFAGMGINIWIQGITNWDSAPVDLQNIISTAQKFLGQYLEKCQIVEQRVDELTELVHQHDGEVDRIFHPDGQYFSIRGYSRKLKQQVTRQEASEKGRAAAKISRQLGVDIDKLEDPRYGEVNIYHESILEQVFSND